MFPKSVLLFFHCMEMVQSCFIRFLGREGLKSKPSVPSTRPYLVAFVVPYVSQWHYFPHNLIPVSIIKNPEGYWPSVWIINPHSVFVRRLEEFSIKLKGRDHQSSGMIHPFKSVHWGKRKRSQTILSINVLC